jgi:hypothetical protein
MTAGQARFPIAPSHWQFAQQGKSGRYVSELLPWTGKLVDDITLIHTMQTDAINHEPAILLMNTGNMNPGKPSLGSWLAYGLGSMNENLPTYVVLNSTTMPGTDLQPISPKLWSSGFLSSEYAGVAFRTKGAPVLYLEDPSGMSRNVRRELIDAVNSITWTLYGDEAKQEGSFAYNCLLARRMAERGVRFTQVYQRGWDVHSNAVGNTPKLTTATDRGSYALVTDLKRRGLLDDTLVIWGGEFGRTVYSQGGLSKENYGRDHHPRCFTVWMAGGGTKEGYVHGQTDDFCYNVVKDPVHVRDFNATVLSLLGMNHERFTFKFQGLEQKLTGVVPAKVIPELIA